MIAYELHPPCGSQTPPPLGQRPAGSGQRKWHETGKERCREGWKRDSYNLLHLGNLGSLGGSVHRSLDVLDGILKSLGLSLEVLEGVGFGTALSLESLLLGIDTRTDILELDKLLLGGELGDTGVGDLNPLLLGGEVLLHLVELTNAIVEVRSHLLNVSLSLLHDLDLVHNGLLVGEMKSGTERVSTETEGRNMNPETGKLPGRKIRNNA